MKFFIKWKSWAKAFGVLVVAYAFSPIDLIPEEIMEDCKIKAANALKKQKNWGAGRR